jgi:hypothetical protein
MIGLGSDLLRLILRYNRLDQQFSIIILKNEVSGKKF